MGIRRLGALRGDAGFTLVELAIVLVIMGLVGVLFYGTISKFLGREKASEANVVLEYANEALVGRAARAGSMPDPKIDGNQSILPSGFAESADPWSKELRYWLAEELVGGHLVAAEHATTLRLEFYSDASQLEAGVAPQRVVEDVVYVLASSGPNQTLQIWYDNAPPDAPKVIRVLAQGGSRDTGAGADYDDSYRYATLNELRAKITAVQ